MQFKVEVGSADERAGDTLSIEADDVEAATAAALADDLVVSNGWVVHAVYQLASGVPAQPVDHVAALADTQPMELLDDDTSH